MANFLRAARRYSSCVRQAEGYCCVQWSVCPDQTNAFSIDNKLPAADDMQKAQTDNLCTLDYIGIAGEFCIFKSTFARFDIFEMMAGNCRDVAHCSKTLVKFRSPSSGLEL